MTDRQIYLDFNAGASLHPAAKEVLRHFYFLGNPSSLHTHGREAKKVLERARAQVAQSIGAHPRQITFTSCGTEANQTVIQSFASSSSNRVLSPVEHSSAMPLPNENTRTFEVGPEGEPLVDSIGPLIDSQTQLISSIWVNNETGVISPIEEVGAIARARNLPLHVDAAQAWGKLSIDVQKLPTIDFLTFSGYKIGAMPGVGVIWAKDPDLLKPLIFGSQERKKRGGTENLPAIATLGAVAETLNSSQYRAQTTPLRDELEQSILDHFPDTIVRVNGRGSSRVGNTLNLSFRGVEGDTLLMKLDLAGFSLSSGSACAAGVLEPSHVLMAMGRSKQEARSALRISISPQTQRSELESFFKELKSIVRVDADTKSL